MGQRIWTKSAILIIGVEGLLFLLFSALFFSHLIDAGTVIMLEMAVGISAVMLIWVDLSRRRRLGSHAH